MFLKVLIFIRSDASEHKGGDYNQALDYAEVLRQLGHEVKLQMGPTQELQAFDIVHLFNSYRVVEGLRQLRYAREAGVKTVLTPIWHADETMKRLYRELYKLPSPFYALGRILREWRYCRRNNIRASIAECFSYRSAQKQLLTLVDGILPNSNAEKRFIESDLGIQLGMNWIIPNSLRLNHQPMVRTESSSIRSGFLCVGRIEPLKNQIDVLTAFEGLDGLQGGLEFVGKQGSHRAYFKSFKRLVDKVPGVRYAGELQYGELVERYRKSKGVIHASHFETTGLIGMEALSNGAALSITDNEYTREYYSGFAHFCQPSSIESIRQGFQWINNDSNASLGFCPKSWDEIGKELVYAYQKCLAK